MSKWDVREACRNGDCDWLKKLIGAKAPLDELDIDETLGYIEGQICWRPIHHAAANDKDKCIELLLDAGVNANSITDSGMSAMLIAAERGQLNAVKCLLKRGADPRLGDKGGQRPLLLASSIRNIDVVKEILKHIKPEQASDIDNDGWTALHHAAAVGYTPIVELLVTKYKCKVEQKDYEGWNSLGLAIANNKLSCAKRIIELAAGSEKELVNVIANGGNGALYIAAVRGYAECLQLLIDHGAEVNVVNDEGDHPLWAAEAKGHMPCVHILTPLTDPEYVEAE